MPYKLTSALPAMSAPSSLTIAVEYERAEVSDLARKCGNLQLLECLQVPVNV